jgi:hypothetical protein
MTKGEGVAQGGADPNVIYKARLKQAPGHRGLLDGAHIRLSNKTQSEHFRRL